MTPPIFPRDDNYTPVLLWASTVDWSATPVKVDPASWAILMEIVWGSSAESVFWIDTWTANAIVVNTDSPISALTTWDEATFIVANTSTSTTPTLNVDWTGAVVIKKSPTDAVFPYDLMAGKMYTCRYNAVGTPFWQIINPESSMIVNSTGVAITASVPSQFATVADAYAYYLRVASSSNIGWQSVFQIRFDAPGIYDVSSSLAAAPSVPLVLSTTGTASPSSTIGTHVNGIVAWVGSSTIEIASPPPTTAVVWWTIYLARWWTNNQNHGNYEITNITGNVITFATPRGDCVTEAGWASSKYVQFFPTVVRSAGSLWAMFLATADCRIDSSGIAYRGRSALADNNDTFASVSLGWRFNFSGLVNCYAVGISAASGSQVRQTSLASFYGCYTAGISMWSCASYISWIQTSPASQEANWTKLIYCGKSGWANPAVLLGSGAIFYNIKPILYTLSEYGIYAQENAQVYLRDATRVQSAQYELVTVESGEIKVTTTSASTRMDATIWGKIYLAWTWLGTASIPMNSTQADGWFVWTAEDGWQVTTVTGSTNLTLKSQIVAVNSASPSSIVLPALSANVTVRYTIKNIGAWVVTITAADAKTIDWAASQVLLQWQSITIQALGGTQWIIS